MNRTTALLLGVSVLLAGFACRREESPGGAPLTPASAAAARRYPLKGVIRQVEPARSRITVEHEDVPGYMPGMTMEFPLRDDPQVIQILRPGDRIEATLVVQGDAYWLERVLTKGFVPTPSIESASSASQAPTPRPNRAIAPGDLVPDFALTDQTGRTIRLSQLRGAPVAVTFLYTRCPVATACPMTTAKFSRLSAMLREKPPAQLLVITVDPEHDTPEVLADYAKKAGADPRRWKFLTGAPAEVAEVASRFGVLYSTEHSQVIHGQAVAVVDPKGRLSTIYYGEQWEPEHILRDIENSRKG